MLKKSQIEKLPKEKGVYIFFQDKTPLYVGKSVNIKARVTSHWQNAKLDKKEALIITTSDRIKYYLTSSDFHALLLEAKLIQKLKPKYNARGRDDKSKLYIVITSDKVYPRIKLLRKTELGENKQVFGPFPSKKVSLEVLRIIRKIIPFCQQDKILKRGCFYSRIGLCQPCPSEIEKITDKNLKNKLIKEYQNNIKKIISILMGNDQIVLKWLRKKINQLIKKEKFEEAIVYRNKWQLYQFLVNEKVFSVEENSYNKFLDLAEFNQFLNRYFGRNKIRRIEVYDISHSNEKMVVGSMICWENGDLNKNSYRRFKINKKLKDDQERLKEVIKRRFKHNWPRPDLIIIDGGKPQIKRVKEFLDDLNISLIGIAKNPDRLIIGTTLETVKPKINDPSFSLIRFLRDEAHRFAINYHRLLRRKNLYN